MSKRTKSRATKAAVSAIERGPGRSTLFYWMVDNHEELSGAALAKPIRWAHLCNTVHALGLTDTEGNPPSPAMARKTWYRARLVVRRQQSARQALASAPVVRMLPPTHSQSPAGWQPAYATPRSSPQPQPLPPPADTTAETEAEAEARADANIARIQRHIDEAAGRIPPRGTNS